jgi:hypothetical protein
MAMSDCAVSLTLTVGGACFITSVQGAIAT